MNAELNCTEFYLVNSIIFLDKELAIAQAELVAQQITQEVEDYKAKKIDTCYFANHDTLENGAIEISVNKALLPQVVTFSVGSASYNDALNWEGTEKIQWGNPALCR